MSEWTPNDYSNILTVGAAALCSVLLILFKSRRSARLAVPEPEIEAVDPVNP